MDSVVIGEGFLGAKIVDIFRQKGIDAQGTSLEKNRGFLLDITDKNMVDKFFSSNKPKNAVLCASFPDVDLCDALPEKARKINVEGTKNVADACKKNNARLAFISTDYVFDGEKGNYSETDKPNPIQVYGKTKLEAEKAVLQNSKNLVMRVSSLYGKSRVEKKTFEQHIIQSLSHEKTVKAAVDQTTCPTLIDDVALAIFLLWEKNESGLFHATGSEAITRFDFALKVAEKFSLDKKFIEKTTMEMVGFKAKRPKDSSLSIKKIQGTGIKMSDIDSGLEKTKKAIGQKNFGKEMV